MSKFYQPRRTRNLYDPWSSKPFRLSRSKLDLFLNCPRCFYLDRRLGVGRPPGYPFNLNNAVDALLKREFDGYRERSEAHPLFVRHGLDLRPFAHPELDRWRDSLRRGIEFALPGTNLMVTGGIDDLWIDRATKELVIADYKATSKDGPVSIDADWQIGYRRQAEVYQWLFRRNGFAVSRTAYFVYCNALTTASRFDGRLNFEISLLPYAGDDGWVEGAVRAAHACLGAESAPSADPECDHCRYLEAANAEGATPSTTGTLPLG